jgi:hypothetical protein
MFMWIILAALAFGAVFDGLGAVAAIEGCFVEHGFQPWMILILMQLSFLADGDLSRRHRDAGDRRAALCAAGRRKLWV